MVAWKLWTGLPHVALWEAVALSLNLEPNKAMLNLIGRAPPRYSRPGLPAEFFGRMAICQRALSTVGPIKPQGPVYRGVLQNPRCDVLVSEVAAFLVRAGFTVPTEMRAMLTNVADTVRSAATVAAPSLMPDPASDESLPADAVAKRAKLLAMFREFGGKRPCEGGKKGKHGALAALERNTGIDDKNLGQLLDKAIQDKRGADAFRALGPKPMHRQ